MWSNDKEGVPQLRTSQSVYEGFYQVQHDLFANGDGSSFCYATVATRSDAALVLARSQAGLWILTKEYRYPMQKWLLSLPGGYMDGGELPEETAARELFEETGYVANQIRALGQAYPYPGISRQKIHYFFADGCSGGAMTAKEAGEYIQVELWDPLRLSCHLRDHPSFPLDGNLCTALYFVDR